MPTNKLTEMGKIVYQSKPKPVNEKQIVLSYIQMGPPFTGAVTENSSIYDIKVTDWNHYE